MFLFYSMFLNITFYFNIYCYVFFFFQKEILSVYFFIYDKWQFPNSTNANLFILSHSHARIFQLSEHTDWALDST